MVRAGKQHEEKLKLDNIFNNNYMKSRASILPYLTLEDRLYKKSTNIFLGYQPKSWKILDQGTRIAYKNQADDKYSLQKTFDIITVYTEEMESEVEFLLHTPKRVYQLRAQTEAGRKQWMRAITLLRKQIQRKRKRGVHSVKKHNNILSAINDSTLPSIGVGQIQQNLPNSETGGRLNTTRTSKLFAQFSPPKSQQIVVLPDRFKQLLKKMPASYSQYHVFISKLKTKGKQLFIGEAKSNYFLFFSSKSLQPDEFINEDNLTTAHLPHWADLDIFYRVGEDFNHSKPVFQMAKVTEIKEVQSYCAVQVIGAEGSFDLECEDLESREKLKAMLQIGQINALQCRNGHKRNYDGLILLRSTNVEEFTYKVSQMIAPHVPKQHNFELSVITKLIEGVSPLLIEVTRVLESKVKVPMQTIVDFLKLLHEQVRVHLKLSWDTSNHAAKGGDILNILKVVSRYQSLVNTYVKDTELLDALKQLSKFYVRACYRNFEGIILGIVQQERGKNNYLVEEEDQQAYLQTHAITDLFKFIYDVFAIAIPCWNSKLHLHNIHRLIRKALAVFVKELKALVDEEDLPNDQLIGIANNYVQFNEEVESFYEDKLIQLKEQTRQYYDDLRDEYREVSLLVIDKLVMPLKLQLRLHFEQQPFFTVQLEHAYKLITSSTACASTGKLHFIFQKRCFERIFALLREQICRMLEREARKIGKKKPDINKVLERLQNLKADCVEMQGLICKSKVKGNKQFSDLRLLLTGKKQEVKEVLTESSQIYRRIYLKALAFRQDYTEDSGLYKYIQSLQLQKSRTMELPRQMVHRGTLSKHYIEEFDRSSVSSVEKSEMTNEEKIRMISEGEVLRSKQGGSYEHIFLKFKKGVLYIYEDSRMQRCQNTLQVEDIAKIDVLPDRPVFIVTSRTLSRNKEMRFKCESIEESSRWVYTLQVEMRRMENDRKMRWKGVRIKEKRSKLIIDYAQINGGPDFFSYQE